MELPELFLITAGAYTIHVLFQVLITVSMLNMCGSGFLSNSQVIAYSYHLMC